MTESLNVAREKLQRLVEMYTPSNASRTGAVSALGAGINEFEAAVREDERAALHGHAGNVPPPLLAGGLPPQPPAPVFGSSNPAGFDSSAQGGVSVADGRPIDGVRPGDLRGPNMGQDGRVEDIEGKPGDGSRDGNVPHTDGTGVDPRGLPSRLGDPANPGLPTADGVQVRAQPETVIGDKADPKTPTASSHAAEAHKKGPNVKQR